MTSKPVMSIQVERSPTSPLLSLPMDAVLGRQLFMTAETTDENENRDGPGGGATHAMVGSGSVREGERVDRSIVAAEILRQNPWEKIVKGNRISPSAQVVFAEHRETDTRLQTQDAATAQQLQLLLTASSTQHSNNYTDDNNTLNDASALSSPLPLFGGGLFSSDTGDDVHTIVNPRAFATTPSVLQQQPNGSFPKPIEYEYDHNREHPLGAVLPTLSSQQPAYPQPHHHHHQEHPSLASLSQQQIQPTPPPPQRHTATAAEIALGTPSLYHQALAMGDGSRSRLVSGAGGSQARPDPTESKQQEQPGLSRTSSSHSGKETGNGEETTRRTSDAVVANTPGRTTPLHDSSDNDSAMSMDHPSRLTMIGTPSTASTAPSSTDEASIGTVDYRLEDAFLPNLLHPLGHEHDLDQHRRAQSWEEGLLPALQPQQLQFTEGHAPRPSHNPWNSAPAAASIPQNMTHPAQRPSWGGLQPRGSQHPMQQQHQQLMPQNVVPQAQQRVASFRKEGSWAQHVASPNQHLQLPRQVQYMASALPQQQPFLAHPYVHSQQVPQAPQPPPQVTRKSTFTIPPGPHSAPMGASPAATPNRNVQQPRNQASKPAPIPTPGSGAHQHSATSSVSHRSSSEVLKTLLRKKACLYEPDTSRSVALVTWLVGRELAFEYGFFSRQQLQSGVHACVSSKIEAGIITRTKVNRCMQIILNSCFHYIIPRSDGTEENGDHFRDIFARSVQDDSNLLLHLPEPWNDLLVRREVVLEASLFDDEDQRKEKAPAHWRPSKQGKNPSTPKTSPRLSSMNADKSPERDDDDGDHESKRAVLLCFNENVRSAEDVFRCHNEFIRDTANAAHLQLTAQEWRQFFGREVSRSPHLWGNVGIPTLTGESSEGPPRQPDLLGQMSREEAAKFRTTWCTKRYEHNHDLCGFSHVEVNGGWLRRNPVLQPYKDEMCPYVVAVRDKQVGGQPFFLNECPEGVLCNQAHSIEEILYHPNQYKTKVCTSLYSRSGGCRLGDVCPHVHPPETTRPLKKSEGRSHGHGHRRKNSKDANAAGSTSGTKPLTVATPTGAPVVYASPAPFSSFEHQLGMPGLRNLFRRHSAVIRAHVRSSGKCTSSYSPFGDDWGIGIIPGSKKAAKAKRTSVITTVTTSAEEAGPAVNPAATIQG